MFYFKEDFLIEMLFCHSLECWGVNNISHTWAGLLNCFKPGSIYKGQKFLRFGHSHEIIQT